MESQFGKKEYMGNFYNKNCLFIRLGEGILG
jgi:hypothetical protein